MNPLNSFLDACRRITRNILGSLAKALNTFSGGKLHPNVVTITSLLGHVLIAYLIATRHPLWSALLLVIFGLMDTLDGELARLQGRASAAGMLLDATTDRIKEILLYIGVAYFFVLIELPYVAVWAVAACGASLCVSYVKAKGETAVAKVGLTPNEVNRLFQDGLLRYEVRMFLLVVGLLTALLPEILIIITVLGTYTIFERLIKISRKL